MNISIAELKHLSNEDAEFRIRERIEEAMILTGKPELGIRVLWHNVIALQSGQCLPLALSEVA